MVWAAVPVDIEPDETAVSEAVMLSRTDARRAATALLYRFGEVAIAAAVLRAQEARAAGRHQSMVDWYRIAEAAASRVTADAARPSTAA
jgi:hypothetical protein